MYDIQLKMNGLFFIILQFFASVSYQEYSPKNKKYYEEDE